MLLIICEVNLILTQSENWVMVYTYVANQGDTFEMKNAKLYVPVVILPTQDNAELLTQ